MQLLFVENHSDRQDAALSAHGGTRLRDHILFREIVSAAHDLLEPFAAGHDLDHQAAALRMALMLVDDVAFLQWHVTPQAPGARQGSRTCRPRAQFEPHVSRRSMRAAVASPRRSFTCCKSTNPT